MSPSYVYPCSAGCSRRHTGLSAALPIVSEPASTPDVRLTSGPVREPVPVASEPRSALSNTGYNPRHPPHLSDVAVSAFADLTAASSIVPGACDGQSPPRPTPVLSDDQSTPPDSSVSSSNLPADSHTPSNFSQSGIVHLSPIGDIGDASGRSSSGVPSSGRRFRSVTFRRQLCVPGTPRNPGSTELRHRAIPGSAGPTRGPTPASSSQGLSAVASRWPFRPLVITGVTIWKCAERRFWTAPDLEVSARRE